jgi:23S rRNA pseudouridine1911/1915/1917 synthase
VRSALDKLEGQALHAEALGFVHPTSGRRLRFNTPPPADFLAALMALRSLGNRAG